MGDVAHVDVAHVDVAHVDVGHVDVGHVDVAHGDVGHVDVVHVDVAHGDVAHVDVAHVDVAHVDVAHVDEDKFIRGFGGETRIQRRRCQCRREVQKLVQNTGARLSRRGLGAWGPTELRMFLYCSVLSSDRLCGLVVGVSGYRYRGPGFDPRRYQIF